ncbi:homoserine O-acetyltransferase [Melanomma pulvis-pyrius CBS 109.77]|uniref:Homoserine O-acetyltransferase n=1 Tax=Melanomma pulvis-pyrius CBS 109.77 TaxID=1314802 RepID=A0A6A6X497_9PLEO|nr:homoserine O-acetyltransferase [Melanomma pulvis-pyrius CBS 109.77]
MTSNEMENQTAVPNNGIEFKEGTGLHLRSENDAQNFYSTFVENQDIALIQSFTFESGITLNSIPVAYSTWGTLNESRDNVLVLCHALTGSSDAQDWWRPLMGAGKALDYSRYFVFCANVLGSPYGSASPLSTNPTTGLQYGPQFPDTTIRDDVRIHKLVLDELGVYSIAAVIGGSMGGMTTLEWPLCTSPGYVKNIIPIATSAYHGAWGISWGETQRQAIYSDAAFQDGWYDPQPEGQPQRGLGTARMIAMLTYRSHESFEARFSRRPATAVKKPVPLPTPPPSHRGSLSSDQRPALENSSPPKKFSAQSYMQYQAEKFLKRFDANCYIHLTKKMDTHDVTHGRLMASSDQQSYPPSEDQLRSVLRNVPPRALVVSVGTDVLFRPEQQMKLASCLPDAKFVELESPDGHDGFLLEFEMLNRLVRQHLKEQCPWVYEGEAKALRPQVRQELEVINSVFGETEAIEF